MSEIRYMISDAARQAGVEAHVLRSWEEELDIKVGRTELGHRYYTDKTIYIMKKVKELRDKGFQLKAIKVLIPEIQKKAEEITEIAEEKNAVMKDTATKTEKAEHTEKTDSDANLKDSTQEVPKPQTILPFVDSLDNLEKFQDIVGDIMKRALHAINCIDGVFQDVRRQEQYYLVDCNHADRSFRFCLFCRQSVLFLFIWSTESGLSYFNHHSDGYFQL